MRHNRLLSHSLALSRPALLESPATVLSVYSMKTRGNNSYLCIVHFRASTVSNPARVSFGR
jgi:hypothetical protein